MPTTAVLRTVPWFSRSHADSLKFAAREGRPELRGLLLPRTKGFYACLTALPDAVVYDMTLVAFLPSPLLKPLAAIFCLGLSFLC